jgi:hypothetical protein
MFGPSSFVIWIVFALMWIFEPSALGGLYQGIHGLPLWLEVITWLVFLPWVFALWIWQTSLALWLRIALIFIVAMFTGGFHGQNYARKRKRRRKQMVA